MTNSLCLELLPVPKNSKLKNVPIFDTRYERIMPLTVLTADSLMMTMPMPPRKRWPAMKRSASDLATWTTIT